MSWIRWMLFAAASVASAGNAASREGAAVVVTPAPEIAPGEKAQVEFFATHSPREDKGLAIRLGEIGRSVGELLLCRGNVAYLGSEYAEARSRYDAALAIRPGWSAAKHNLALAYDSAGQVGEALSLWHELVDDAQYGAPARQRVREIAQADARNGEPTDDGNR